MQMDVEAIERAAVAGVPPLACEELGGWLLNFDPGPVGRAASAVPLAHGRPPGGFAPRLFDRYAARGLPPMFRLPRIAAFADFCQGLAQQGFAVDSPSLMQVGAVQDILQSGDCGAVDLAPHATAAWQQGYLALYSDPVAAQGRLTVLARSTTSVFAMVRVDGEAAAVGVGAFHGPWLCINAMNTRPAHRRRGLASRILGALACEAKARGVQHAVLQVEEDNARAQALYARAGFRTAWAYDYWQK